jgi:hypothetical protein
MFAKQVLLPLHQLFLVMGFFQDRVLQTICLGWLQISFLLISASQIARITSMSHQHPTCNVVFYFGLVWFGFGLDSGNTGASTP